MEDAEGRIGVSGLALEPLANHHTGMLAEFLVGFLKAGVQNASLVGNSMGAGVALYNAVLTPGWLTGVTRSR